MSLQYTLEIDNIESLKGIGAMIKENNLEKPNISKVARDLKICRDTARKHLNGFIKQNTRTKTSKVDKHYQIIKELLNHDSKVFEYKSHLYRYLQKNHDVDYTEGTFSRYINKYFKSEFKNNNNRLSERFETEPGKQVQFDYKENQTYIDSNGDKHKVDIAALTFGYSRFTIREIIADKTTTSTIDFLAKSFEIIGGVPDEIVIDNGPSLVQLSRTKDREAILIPRLEQFLKDYNIKCNVCMPYSPQTKGKVEVRMKLVDELKAYNSDFKDLYELDKILQDITSDENLRISQATGLPASYLFEKEKNVLQCLPQAKVRSNYFISLIPVKVNKNSLVSYKSKLYSVPPEYIGMKMQRTATENKLHLYYNKKYICSHNISQNKINYLPAHKKLLRDAIYKNADIVSNLTQLDDNINSLSKVIYE